MSRYRVAIYGKSYSTMIDLVNKHKIQVLDHGSRKLNEHLYRAYALLLIHQIVGGRPRSVEV